MKSKTLESPLSIHIGAFFSRHLTVERGASRHTIRSYANALTGYLEYLETVCRIKVDKVDTSVLTRNNVLDYLGWLEQDRGVSIQTRNQRLAAIHSLCRFLQHDDIVHIDRWHDILTIRTKKYRPRPMAYLSVEGMKLLLEQISTDTAVGRRNLTMLALLYETGARVNELIHIRLCDLHLESPAYLILQGKGNKNRAVPLQDKVVALLKRYIEEFDLGRHEVQSETLFKNRIGERLTSAGVTYLLMKYVTLAHKRDPSLVPPRITPHCLRHSKAMHLLQAGVKLVYIRDMLGHVSISTTEIYARADSRQKREALEAAYRDIIPDNERGTTPVWETNSSLKEWLKSLGKHSG